VVGPLLWLWRSVALRVILICAIVALVAVILWGSRLNRAHFVPALGDLGGWVQGIGTLAAALVALVQVRQLQVARIADRSRQEDQERTRVYGWVAYRRDGGGGWWAQLNNMTPVPIAVWVLRVTEADSGREVVTLNADQHDPLYPGSTSLPVGVPPEDLLRALCVLEFLDSAGRCWRRDAGGRLSEIDEILVAGQAMVTSTRIGEIAQWWETHDR
jgi:hypothetical protein